MIVAYDNEYEFRWPGTLVFPLLTNEEKTTGHKQKEKGETTVTSSSLLFLPFSL